ncbi:twin-arginine translocation signal domain-containing protein [Candidatus Roizmanbacteria bacterium]|nr:twin-arginine translocation signal domain-containing protein [Candidatus Roizmanbacteria bacterium]
MMNKSEFEQQDNPLARVRTSRRDFLKLVGLGTAAALAAKLGSEAPTAEAATDSPLPQPGSPLPEAGEALAESGPYIVPIIYEAPQEAITEAETTLDAINIRSDESTDKPSLGQLLKGSRVKIVRETNVAYPAGGPNSFWVEIEDTIQDGKFVDDGTPEYIVNFLSGQPTYTIISRKEAVATLPPSEPVAVAAMTDLFAPTGVGGPGPLPEADKAFAEAIGIEANEEGEFVIDSSNPYIGFLRLEYTAARGAITNFVDGEDTAFVTVGRIGEEETGKTLRVFVKKLDDNTYEMISSRIGEGLFTYRKIETDENKNIIFSDSSLLSWNAVSSRYGEEAAGIAQQITSVGETSVIQVDEEKGAYTINTQVDEKAAALIQSVSSSENYRVYLPARDAFAPQVEVPGETETSGRVLYIPQANTYAAEYQGTEGQTLSWFYQDFEGEGEWVNTPDQNLLTTEIEQYKLASKLSPESDVAIGYVSGSKDGQKFSFACARNEKYDLDMPLMVAKQTSEGEWEWGRFERGFLAQDLKIINGVYSVGWYLPRSRNYAETLIRDSNYLLLDDAVNAQVLILPDGSLNQTEYQKLWYSAAQAKANGISYSIGSGLITGKADRQSPYALNELGRLNEEEKISLAVKQVELLLSHEEAQDLECAAIANEMLPHLLGISNTWTETYGINRTRLLQAVYRRARELVPNTKLAIRDFSVVFSDTNRQDGNDAYPRTTQFLDMIKDLNDAEMQKSGKKLIDVAEAQLPLFLEPLIGIDPSMNVQNYIDPEQRATMMERLVETKRRCDEMGVEFRIVELFIPLDNLPGNTVEEKKEFQAVLYHDIYKVCAENSIPVSIFQAQTYPQGGPGNYPPDSISPYSRDEQLSPTPAHYGINAGIMDSLR